MRHPTRPRSPDLTTLGKAAAAGATMLTLACRKCERRGRLSVARLLAEWGEHAALADIMDHATADCPRRGETRIYELCGAHMPDLPGLFGTSSPAWTPRPKMRRD